MKKGNINKDNSIMYYLELSLKLEAMGYKKTKNNLCLCDFTTVFEKDDNKINIDWMIGGYVKNVTYTTEKENITFDSAADFAETLV